MADHLSPERRSVNMSRIRSSGTKPEMLVRRLLHSRGYRFRCHVRQLPGSPDLVFSKRKKVVLVHGCFWHQHPDCPRATRPKSREEYWDPKLRGNVQKDLRTVQQLNSQGWHVLTVWECETGDRGLAHRLAGFLGPPRIY